MAALLIVVGLGLSVPPSFGAAEGDHFGQLLHPLFPHVHGSATSPYTPDGVASAHDDSASLSDDLGLSIADHVPGIRGQAADEGFRSALSGIVLPTILVGVLLHLGQLRQTDWRLAQQAWRGPPPPPPRRTTPVVVMH